MRRGARLGARLGAGVRVEETTVIASTGVCSALMPPRPFSNMTTVNDLSNHLLRPPQRMDCAHSSLVAGAPLSKDTQKSALSTSLVRVRVRVGVRVRVRGRGRVRVRVRVRARSRARARARARTRVRARARATAARRSGRP